MLWNQYILQLGKEFQKRLQQEWSGTITGDQAFKEQALRLGTGTLERRSRIDIFVGKVEDFVTVLEIKATNLDRISPENRFKLLGADRRQTFRYMDKFLLQYSTIVPQTSSSMWPNAYSSRRGVPRSKAR